MNRTLAAQFAQDLRHGIRVFRRQPGFSVTAVLTLALGIGANTALFALLDGLLLRPLPVQNPHELARLTTRGGETFGFQIFDRIRRESRHFASVIAVQQINPRSSIEDASGLRDATVHVVSGDYFPALGISAAAGRVFGPAETAWADESVAVVSDVYRRARYTEADAVLGSRLRYLNRDFTIIGVAPATFTGTIAESPADVWVPLTQTHAPDSMMWTRASFLKVMGRLHPGTTLDTALAEVSAIAGANRRLGVEPGGNGFSSLRERFTGPLLILQALVGLVLLVACANLANLLLARGAARQREIAIRLAIGASRGRLVRQLATESLLLVLAGGVLALGVAAVLTSGVLALLPPAFAGAAAQLDLRLDRVLLLFALGVSLLTGLVFGLGPALRATRVHHAASLRSRLTGPGERSLTSRALVVCAVAVSVALVAGAGLFVRTLHNLWNHDNGFAAAHVVVAEIELHPGSRAFPALSQYEDLLARVRGIAGVQAAGFSRIGQLAGGFIEFGITVPGESLTPEQRAAPEDAIEQRISPGFLDAMGTRILSGRDVADADTADAPQVALVNETFVRRYLDGGNAVGRQFMTQTGDYRIVGVVEDTKWVNLREESRAMFYRPMRQSPAPGATFAVRTSRPLRAVADSLRREAAAAGLSLRDIVPFTEVVNRTLVTERMLAFLSGGIGFLALLIVAVGLYGVMAYSVARRTNELGIRRALGATGAQLQWLVLRESLWLFGIGVTAGIVIVAITAPVAGSLLFGLAAIDVPTIAGTIGLLLAVTLAASSGPARRAARVDPLVAMRTE